MIAKIMIGGKSMKKLLIILLVLTFLISVAVPVMAAKPTSLPDKANAKAKVNFNKMLTKQVRKGHLDPNDYGFEEYSFRLAGDVIDSTDYELADIPGSDFDSKLLVNQPNGESVAVVTGVMKGLTEGVYTAYISRVYIETEEPWYVKTEEQWNVIGDYEYDFVTTNETYPHTLTIATQENGLLSGTGSNTAGAITETVNGTIVGDVVTLNVVYDDPANYNFDAVLEIDEFGILSGSALQGTNTIGKIDFTSGNAVTEVTSSTWTGALSSTIEPIEFLVDKNGNGSFTVVIIPEDVEFLGEDVEFSVWITNNNGVTILISDDVPLAE